MYLLNVEVNHKTKRTTNMRIGWNYSPIILSFTIISFEKVWRKDMPKGVIVKHVNLPCNNQVLGTRPLSVKRSDLPVKGNVCFIDWVTEHHEGLIDPRSIHGDHWLRQF